MHTIEHRIRFATPAFLGNAEQAGQWRSPPFKALLRQWWRVVYAARNHFNIDVGRMRREEALLFGTTVGGDGGQASAGTRRGRSRVRIRLDHWTNGKLLSWDKLERRALHHPELRFPTGAHAYLGYGPLAGGRGGTKLKRTPAIGAGEEACLAIAVPDAHVPDVEEALALMHAYGTVGGRSRNGWGSFALGSCDDDNATVDLSRFGRPWLDALHLDWPHAVGRDDGGPLVWATRTASTDDWATIMRTLAAVKIGLRTMFVFPRERDPHPKPSDRHVLSYPVTNHRVRSWRGLRLPNSLRFKVRADNSGQGTLRGIIFHVPCRPPERFNLDPNRIEPVWSQVHELLDASTVVPPDRRDYPPAVRQRPDLRAQMDAIQLERIPH